MAITAQDRNIDKAQVNDFIDVIVNKMSDLEEEKKLKSKYEEKKSLVEKDGKDMPGFLKVQKKVFEEYIKHLENKITNTLGTQTTIAVTKSPEESKEIAKTVLKEIYGGSLEGTLYLDELVNKNNKKISNIFLDVDAENPYIIEEADKEDTVKRIFLPQPDFNSDLEKEESSQYVKEDDIDLYIKTLFSANRLKKVIEDVTNSLIGENSQMYNIVYDKCDKQISHNVVSAYEGYKSGEVTKTEFLHNDYIKELASKIKHINPDITSGKFNFDDFELLVNSRCLQQNLYDLKNLYLDKVIEEVKELKSKSTDEPQVMVKISTDDTCAGNIVNIAKVGWSGVVSVHVTEDRVGKIERSCGRAILTKQFNISSILPAKFNEAQIKNGKKFFKEARFSSTKSTHIEQPKALLEGGIEEMFFVKERDRLRESRWAKLEGIHGR